MNTTPTRMVYDRYNKATTAKYSRSISHNTHSHRQGNSRKREQPTSSVSPIYRQAYHQANHQLEVRHCCLAHTECRAQRCGTFSRGKERRNTPLTWSVDSPYCRALSQTRCPGCVDPASVLHWWGRVARWTWCRSLCSAVGWPHCCGTHRSLIRNIPRARGGQHGG